MFRNVGEDHPYAALIFLENLGEALSLAVEHDAGAGKFEALELVVVRQVFERLIVEGDGVGQVDGGGADVCILAKLPVRRPQIIKIDAAKGLVLADRLRIVHRSGEKVIDINVLEIKLFENVGTARV